MVSGSVSIELLFVFFRSLCKKPLETQKLPHMIGRDQQAYGTSKTEIGYVTHK